MDLLHPQLSTFAAVLEEGSFEQAAKRLAMTPSAVSQRIKALEDRLGHVLVVRQTPCRPTPAGQRLLQRLRPMLALQADAMADFLPAEAGAPQTIPLAVNDDSLNTWFLPALAALHRSHGYLFDVRVDDQDHTLACLREGAVLGAVTAEARALQGCNVVPLGVMRYQAIAAPAFQARHFAAGLTAVAFQTAPMVVYNRKDALQWRFMRRVTRARLQPPIHYLPSATGFIDAAALGLGWCLAPDGLAAPALADGRLVTLDASHSLDVPLYWQYAAVRSPTLQSISAALRTAASAVLLPLPGRSAPAGRKKTAA